MGRCTGPVSLLRARSRHRPGHRDWGALPFGKHVYYFYIQNVSEVPISGAIEFARLLEVVREYIAVVQSPMQFEPAV